MKKHYPLLKVCELLIVSLFISTVHAQDSDKLPIFDTHVHYNDDAWITYSPEEILQKMKNANVLHALVSSSPDEGTRKLYQLDSSRIIPFLRPYYGDVNPSNWFNKAGMMQYFQQRMETVAYGGIGEFHLHSITQADSPIVRQTVRLAVGRDLYLHVHSNAEVVNAIFTYEPEVKILWAHAGLLEPPGVVSQMMDKHRNLWVDISIREYEIAPQGELDPSWQALFLKHPERITIGSDTYIPTRWGMYEKIIEFDRHWLNQLPREVAEKIGYHNALRLFDEKSP